TLESNPRKQRMSARGPVDFTPANAQSPHIILTAATPPLHVPRFSGGLRLRNGLFQIEQGKLETPSGIYQVSGNASLGQKLDVVLAHPGAQGFNVTGTLASPRILSSRTQETRAALKP